MDRTEKSGNVSPSEANRQMVLCHRQQEDSQSISQVISNLTSNLIYHQDIDSIVILVVIGIEAIGDQIVRIGSKVQPLY